MQQTAAIGAMPVAVIVYPNHARARFGPFGQVDRQATLRRVGPFGIVGPLVGCGVALQFRMPAPATPIGIPMATIVGVPMLPAIVAIDRRAGVVENGRPIVVGHVKRNGRCVSAPRVATPVNLQHDVDPIVIGPVDVLQNLGKQVLPVVRVDGQRFALPIDAARVVQGFDKRPRRR